MLGTVIAVLYVGFVLIDVINVFATPKASRAAISHASEMACPLSPSCPEGDKCDTDTMSSSQGQRHHEQSNLLRGENQNEEPRNMILGLVTNNIDLERVVRFLRSCRKVIPVNTDIVFLTDYKSTGSRAAVYDAMRVTEHVFVKGEERGYHFNMGRWMMMRDYVHSVNKTYAKLLFADIRDSICQTDPFGSMQGFPEADQALFVFQEAAPTKRGQDGSINSEGKNKNWVIKCFGPQGLERVKNGTVSCAGITIGGWDAAVKYIDLLSDLILSNPACNDQGVHNYIIYSGELAKAIQPHKLKVHSNEHGWVLTVQQMIGTTMLRDRAGNVLNRDGEPYSMVHQYDRSRSRLEPQYGGMFPLLQDKDLVTQL